MPIDHFIAKLAAFRLDAVFNPYVDRCRISDLPDAPAIRRRNLRAYMEAAKDRTTAVWFGRDLGYRGGRRTGLALTDEPHLECLSACYDGVVLTRATAGPAIQERTASVIWGVIRQVLEPPFLWNVFPFHPHIAGAPLSNRCHTRRELSACRSLIESLLDELQPRTIVAIGKDAYNALTDLGYRCSYVRHPSYGGQADFVRGIAKICGMSNLSQRQGLCSDLSTRQRRAALP